jgi:hypothetical protein
MVRNLLKPGTSHDEGLCMSDLSNLLGDVYGDHSPDAAPVRREPAADQRSAADFDLTSALTAALNSEPAPMPAPAAYAPTVDLSEAPAARSGWASDPASMPSMPSMSVTAPVPAMAGAHAWNPGDDDIFPSSKGAKKKK